MKKSLSLLQITFLLSIFLIFTSPITIHAGQVIIQGVWQFAGAVSISGTVTSTSGGFLAPDGTSGAPAFAFSSQPALGFYKSSASVVTLNGSLIAGATLLSNGNIIASGNFNFSSSTSLTAPSNGIFDVTNNAATIGAEFKVDALPTVASGFGSAPSITAGSTPFAGSVNVGTGAAASSGIVLFGGTAFPSTPFCVVTNTLSSNTLHVTPTATQLTITASAAWTASDIVNWICVSSK